MGKIITQCPSCEGSRVQVTKIECRGCSTTFDGKFEIHPLLKMPEEDLQFIFDFVKCSGSLKDMASQEQVSYPTLRNRLNALIETIENFEVKQGDAKGEVLKLLEEGKISAKEAAKRLQKIGDRK